MNLTFKHDFLRAEEYDGAGYDDVEEGVRDGFAQDGVILALHVAGARGYGYALR